MKHLTMQQLHELGFEITKSYEHDEFMTQQRKKGLITIETTWLKTGEFQSQEIKIDEKWLKKKKTQIKKEVRNDPTN